MRPPAPLAPFGLSVAVAALAGASVVQLCPSLPPVSLAIAGLLVGLGLWRRPDAWRLMGAWLAAVAWTTLVAQSRLDDRLPPSLARQDVVLVGTVVGLPERDAISTRFDFSVESADRPEVAGRRLRLGWYGQDPRLEP